MAPSPSEDPQPGQMGAWAPYYDLIMKFATVGREKALRETTVDLAAVNNGDTVLEVGCGTGSLTLAVARRLGASGEVHGIDIAPAMIQVASRKSARAGNPVTLQVGRIDQLPYPDATFDVTLCSFMIFHMPDNVRLRGLKDIARVLKPGGSLLVVEVANANLEALREPIANAGLTCCTIQRRKFARLAPPIRYLRATALKE